jgi:hypothetical protein
MVSTNILQEKARQQEQLMRRGTPGIPKPPVYGQIIETRETPTDTSAVLEVRIQYDKEVYAKRRGANRFQPLAYPADVIANTYGNDLVGRRCRVEFESADQKRGRVYIAHERRFRGNLSKATSLPAYGTAVFPAGN